MAEKSTSYPQYRKYKNGKSYFKILSANVFEEIKEFEGKYAKHLFEAKILPDRNHIYDLTFDFEKYCEVIPQKEYEEKEAMCF